MTMLPVVDIHPGARDAWGLPARLPAGAVFVSASGQRVVVRLDGGGDPWPPFGHRSVAADPAAMRRQR